MDNAAQLNGAAGAEVLLEAREVHFAYAAGLPEVVCGASLALRCGMLAALIGANGSGKSSLIRLLGGLVRPARGELFFDGVPLSSLEPRARVASLTCRRLRRASFL